MLTPVFYWFLFPWPISFSLFSDPTPGLISRKTLIQKNTHIPMIIAALFTIAKTWKQPRCSSTDELIYKIWYLYIYIYIYVCVCVCMCVHNGILLSYEKNEIMSFAATYLQLGASQVVQCRRCPSQGFDPRIRKITWGRAWQPTPVSCN